MRKRYPNPKLAKINRNYTVPEAAQILGVHKNTVRDWFKRGLPRVDDQRPYLILGAELALFLRNSRAKNKSPCEPDEMYCMRCRSPQVPAGRMAAFRATSPSLGSLEALCPVCGSMMYRRTSLAKIEAIRSLLTIS